LRFRYLTLQTVAADGGFIDDIIERWARDYSKLELHHRCQIFLTGQIFLTMLLPGRATTASSGCSPGVPKEPYILDLRA